MKSFHFSTSVRSIFYLSNCSTRIPGGGIYLGNEIYVFGDPELVSEGRDCAGEVVKGNECSRGGIKFHLF